MRARRFASAVLGVLGLLLCRAAIAATADTAAATQACPYHPTHSMPLAMTWQDYPLLSVALNEQGSVILDFLVRPDGSITDVKVSRSSGFARLDGAAVDAATQRWRFDPVLQDEKPIACRAKVAVVWKLQQSPDELAREGFALVHLDASDFPSGSPALKEKGAAAVMVLVDQNGIVRSARCTQSSGSIDLDSIVLDAARKGKWRYVPAQVGGKPVTSLMGLVVVWPPP
jgi:TonB family protein